MTAIQVIWCNYCPVLAIPVLKQAVTKLLSCMIFSHPAQQPSASKRTTWSGCIRLWPKSDLKSGPWSLRWRDMKIGKNWWVATAMLSPEEAKCTSSLGEIKGEAGCNYERRGGWTGGWGQTGNFCWLIWATSRQGLGSGELGKAGEKVIGDAKLKTHAVREMSGLSNEVGQVENRWQWAVGVKRKPAGNGRTGAKDGYTHGWCWKERLPCYRMVEVGHHQF